MRITASVCFEVDGMGGNSWESVMAWGNYEELAEPEAERGRILLLTRVSNQRSNGSRELSFVGESYIRYRIQTAGRHGLIYRIRVTKKTGRFENYQGAGL